MAFSGCSRFGCVRYGSMAVGDYIRGTGSLDVDDCRVIDAGSPGPAGSHAD
jgi:hypothetical protein